MNELVTVRRYVCTFKYTKQKGLEKDMEIVKIKPIVKFKNIKVHLNALLKDTDYLTIDNDNRISINHYDPNVGYRLFGEIRRSKNKKIFDKLYLTMRLRDE
jgi:hypothetical protein